MAVSEYLTPAVDSTPGHFCALPSLGTVSCPETCVVALPFHDALPAGPTTTVRHCTASLRADYWQIRFFRAKDRSSACCNRSLAHPGCQGPPSHSDWPRRLPSGSSWCMSSDMVAASFAVLATWRSLAVWQSTSLHMLQITLQRVWQRKKYN